MFVLSQSNNSDDLDEDCFQSAKQSLDLQVPLQANAHLYCHASSLQLDLGDISNIFDQKTQKYVFRKPFKRLLVDFFYHFLGHSF